jgi:hypothetical protein
MLVGMVALSDFVYPVMAAKQDGEYWNLLRPDVYGTAFCIGPGLFLTAGHVLSNITSDGGVPLLAKRSEEESGAYEGEPARKFEVLAAYDVGLIAARLPAPAALDWQETPLGVLDDVAMVGYPYSVELDDEGGRWVASYRGLKGSILTRKTLRNLPGRPAGYEVNVRFPKGLSGAPVTPQGHPHPVMRIVGMVLGEQTVCNAGQEFTFGLVLDIASLLDVRSALIGGSFRQLRERLLAEAAECRSRLDATEAR